MRIAHVCLRYPPATGGVETYVRNIVEGVRNINEGRDVRVLTSRLRTHGPLSLLNPELLLDDPMYVQRLHHALTPFVAYPRLQALSYYLAHHDPDVVHGHSFWYQPADVAARYAKKRNIPFILHPYYYENRIRQKAHWQLYCHTIGRRTFATADVVVVISPFEQRLIEQAGFTVKRFVLIPPGVESAALQKPAANPFLARGLTGKMLLSVSRIAPGKGLPELINAMTEVVKQKPGIHLAIVGEDFGLQEKLETQVHAHGLTQKVHFLGKLAADELRGAYQHAILTIHPSQYEAFGIVPAESLAAGTAVVARNVAALPYVVPHQQAGLLFTTKTELVAAILELVNNDDRRRQLAERGQEHVRKNFEQSQTIQKMLNLYESLNIAVTT